MANIHHLKKPVAGQIQEFVADASLAIDIGDLMYLATDDAKPASSQADQLTELGNQALFARNFVGVANSARLSTDATAGVVRVQTDGLYEFPCQSSTFEIGDYVGASEAGSGTALEDQTVEKVTTAGLAIGVVVKRYASATTKVWCRLIGRASHDIANKIETGTASVAAAGSSNSDAAALSYGMNTVSAADGTKGVVLPAPFAGARAWVYNEHASNGLKVYPGTGFDINDGTATTGNITTEGKTLATFIGLDATTWAAQFTNNT